MLSQDFLSRDAQFPVISINRLGSLVVGIFQERSSVFPVDLLSTAEFAAGPALSLLHLLEVRLKHPRVPPRHSLTRLFLLPEHQLDLLQRVGELHALAEAYGYLLLLGLIDDTLEVQELSNLRPFLLVLSHAHVVDGNKLRGVVVGDARVLVVYDLELDVGVIDAVEGFPARAHLVYNAAERPNISFLVEGLPLAHFRREIVQRSIEGMGEQVVLS